MTLGLYKKKVATGSIGLRDFDDITSLEFSVLDSVARVPD